MEKKLTKSNDKHLCGVCGGIAEYINVDPTVVRLLTASFTLLSGVFFGLFVYMLAAIIIPNKK